MKKVPCLQELPPTEPVDQGDEGEWGTVGEVAGSRSPAPTVEELLAQMERQCHTCFSKENQVQTYMHARIKFHAYS
jgi:hypothetical protein